jgi:hypothetical protein
MPWKISVILLALGLLGLVTFYASGGFIHILVSGGHRHALGSVHSGPKKNRIIGGRKQMKPITLIGIVLLVLGALALAYQGISYTHQEKVLDIGPIHATAEKHERIPLPPIVGGLGLVGGVVLLVVGARKKA